MAFLRIEFSLLDKPEVESIAATLGCPSEEVVGRLIRLWTWFSEHTLGGTIVPPSVPGTARTSLDVALTWIDTKARREGFGRALLDVAWVEIHEDGCVVVPKFEKLIGSAKAAREAARRKKEAQRARPSHPVSPGTARDQEPHPVPASSRVSISSSDLNVSSASASPPRPKSSKRTKSEGARAVPGSHEEAASAWCEVFEAEVGKPYHLGGAKDGRQLKRLLAFEDFSIDELRRRAVIFLRDPFWAETGIDLSKFLGQWVALGNAGRAVSGKAASPPTDRDLAEVQQGLLDPDLRAWALRRLEAWEMTEDDLARRAS